MVVCVRGQVGVVVFEDDEVAVAAQAGTGVHHFAVSGSHNRVAHLAVEVEALVLVVVKPADQSARYRPHKGQFVFTARSGCRGGRCGGHHRCSRYSSGRSGFGGTRGGRHRRRGGQGSQGGRGHGTGHHTCGFLHWCGPWGAGHQGLHRHGHVAGHPQHLAHFHQVGILDVVPAHDVAPVLACVQTDTDQCIAWFDRVITCTVGIVVDGGNGCSWECRYGGRLAGDGGAPVFDTGLARQVAGRAPHQRHDCHQQHPTPTTCSAQTHHSVIPLSDARF